MTAKLFVDRMEALGMSEKVLHRNYLKEEEFLDEFYSSASEAAKLLGDDWSPDPHCTDAQRQNRDYFQKTGELSNLTFKSAAVYHNAARRFDSVQIVLESSSRIVNVEVRLEGDKLVATKLLDRSPSAT